MRRATGVPEEWPSRLRFAPQAIQNPAYRPADMCKGARRQKPPGPRQFCGEVAHGSSASPPPRDGDFGRAVIVAIEDAVQAGKTDHGIVDEKKQLPVSFCDNDFLD